MIGKIGQVRRVAVEAALALLTALGNDDTGASKMLRELRDAVAANEAAAERAEKAIAEADAKLQRVADLERREAEVARVLAEIRRVRAEVEAIPLEGAA